MKRILLIAVVFTISLVWILDVHASESQPLFYKNPERGSDSQLGPLNVITNIGFSVLGTPLQTAKLDDIDYDKAGNWLAYNYKNPNKSIEEDYGGMSRFLYFEFVPLSPFSWPNYTLHFFGEGMVSRKLTEYYKHIGFSETSSLVLGVSTLFVAQQVNELMESDAVYGADPVADLVFNSLGLYLFTRDDFASIFASDTLHLHYWPGQPFVDVEDTVLFNNDETYLWRISMGGWTSWKLGVLTGTKINGFGFSVPNKRNEYWSIFFVSLGVQGFPQKPYEPPEVERIRPIKELEEEAKASKDDQTEEEEIEPDQVAVRLTWDEKGSLMTYTDIGYFPKFMLTTNIYPGIWRLGDTGVGLFAHYGAAGTHSLGITLSTLSVLPGYRF